MKTYKFLITILLSTFLPISANAASKPSGVEFPPAPAGSPRSDCEQILKDWKFAEDVIMTKTNEAMFLLIDRYGGIREVPDYRGTMCRVKDMHEMWAVPELFPVTANMAFSPDGKTFINGIGSPPCTAPEDVERIAGMEVLLFIRNGEPVKGYTADQLLPTWREVCQKEGSFQWLSGSYDLDQGISEDNTTFTLVTSDGKKHLFDATTGNQK